MLLHHQTSSYKCTGELPVQEDICISFSLPYCSVLHCSLQLEKGIKGLGFLTIMSRLVIFSQITFVVLVCFITGVIRLSLCCGYSTHCSVLASCVCDSNSTQSEGAEQTFFVSVATRQMYCLHQDTPYHRVTSP